MLFRLQTQQIRKPNSFSDEYGWKIRRTDEYVEKVRFEISQNKKILYKGTLDAAELAKARSLGKFKSGQKGRLEFQLEIPREWDNAYALKNRYHMDICGKRK